VHSIPKFDDSRFTRSILHFGDGLSLELCLGENRIEGKASHKVMSLIPAPPLDGISAVGMKIGLVHANQDRNVEALGKSGCPFQVMGPGDGGFRNNEHRRGSSNGGDDRAANTRWAIGQDQVQTFFFRYSPCLFSNEAHQFSRILLGDPQAGMDEGTKTGVGNEPLSTQVGPHVDGPLRTEVRADSTPLAQKSIHHEFFGYRFKPTPSPAFSTLNAGSRIDECLVPGPEFLSLLDTRRKQQVEVGRIYVRITEDLLGAEGRKGPQNARLSSAPCR